MNEQGLYYIFIISTHAPLARRDIAGRVYSCYQMDFYSRASREARRLKAMMIAMGDDFYSRASREARQKIF